MFKRIFKMLKPVRLQYNIAIITALIAILLEQTRPLIIKFVIDHILVKNDEISPFYNKIVNFLGGIDHLRNNLWVAISIMLLVSAVHMIFIFIRGFISQKAATVIARLHRNELYEHIQNLPYEYHVKAQTGDLIQRCTSDVDTVGRFIGGQFMDIFRISFVLIVTFIILLTLNVKLALVSVSIFPIIYLFSYYFMKFTKKTFEEAEVKEGELSTVLQENLTGVRVVRAFAREDYERNKFREKSLEFKRLTYKHIRYLAIYWSSSHVMCDIQRGISMIYGVYLTVTGEISIGTLIVYSAYINSILWPIRGLGRILANYGRMRAAHERMEEILNTPLETDTEGAVASNLQGDIVFENVSFGYEKDNLVLKDLSFTVKKGETIAILGSTGSGKSSIMHLLLRLYDYKEGVIKINNKELSQIEKNHLRKRIGIVLQEPFLYSKTIMNNIKMAKDVVEENEVLESTKIANAHDFIDGFNDKYNTMVGERGVTLSGGQKQRVAIARTIVKESDILIFDDSLSAVDTHTDALIRAELKKRQQGITTFIISQRITTLMDADRIFVMEDGKITNIGSHQELIQTEGLYKRIWDIQSMLEEEELEYEPI